MANPQTGKTGRPITRHEYFLRTDMDYRANYVSEVILRMAKLIEVLALRSGLEFDPDTGELVGLTEDEESKLMVPAVNRDEVREARPVHRFIPTEVRPMDIYGARPDPDAPYGAEEVGDEPSPPGNLVDHTARNMGYNPSDAGNADVMADSEKAQFGETDESELTDEQLEKFEVGGFNANDPGAEPEPLTATGESVVEANEKLAAERAEGQTLVDGEEEDEEEEGDGEKRTPKEKLQDKAEELGLDASGTMEEIKARIAEHEAKSKD